MSDSCDISSYSNNKNINMLSIRRRKHKSYIPVAQKYNLREYVSHSFNYKNYAAYVEKQVNLCERNINRYVLKLKTCGLRRKQLKQQYNTVGVEPLIDGHHKIVKDSFGFGLNSLRTAASNLILGTDGTESIKRMPQIIEKVEETITGSEEQIGVSDLLNVLGTLDVSALNTTISKFGQMADQFGMDTHQITENSTTITNAFSSGTSFLHEIGAKLLDLIGKSVQNTSYALIQKLYQEKKSAIAFLCTIVGIIAIIWWFKNEDNMSIVKKVTTMIMIVWAPLLGSKIVDLTLWMYERMPSVFENVLNMVKQIVSPQDDTEAEDVEIKADAFSYDLFDTIDAFDIFQPIATVLFVILGLGSVSMLPSKKDEEGLFGKLNGLGEKSRTATSIIQFIKMFGEYAKKFSEYLLEWVYTKLGREKLKADSIVFKCVKFNVKEWVAEVSRLSLEENLMDDMSSTSEKVNEIKILFDQGEEIRQAMMNEVIPMSMSVVLRTSLEQVRKLRDMVYKCKGLNEFRIDPYCIFMTGDPGVGKSTAVMEIMNDLFDHYGYAKKDRLWTRNGGDEYFSNYNKQPCVLFDDIGAIITPGRTSDCANAIGLKSNNAYPLVMAEIERKGMLFCSDLIICTSNMMGLDSNTDIRFHEAFYRRRDCYVKVRMRDGAVKSTSDPTGHLTFQILDTYANNDTCVRSPVMSYGKFIEHLIHEFGSHIAKQKILKARIKYRAMRPIQYGNMKKMMDTLKEQELQGLSEEEREKEEYFWGEAIASLSDEELHCDQDGFIRGSSDTSSFSCAYGKCEENIIAIAQNDWCGGRILGKSPPPVPDDEVVITPQAPFKKDSFENSYTLMDLIQEYNDRKVHGDEIRKFIHRCCDVDCDQLNFTPAGNIMMHIRRICVCKVDSICRDSSCKSFQIWANLNSLFHEMGDNIGIYRENIIIHSGLKELNSEDLFVVLVKLLTHKWYVTHSDCFVKHVCSWYSVQEKDSTGKLTQCCTINKSASRILDVTNNVNLQHIHSHGVEYEKIDTVVVYQLENFEMLFPDFVEHACVVLIDGMCVHIIEQSADLDLIIKFLPEYILYTENTLSNGKTKLTHKECMRIIAHENYYIINNAINKLLQKSGKEGYDIKIAKQLRDELGNSWDLMLFHLAYRDIKGTLLFKENQIKENVATWQNNVQKFNEKYNKLAQKCSWALSITMALGAVCIGSVSLITMFYGIKRGFSMLFGRSIESGGNENKQESKNMCHAQAISGDYKTKFVKQVQKGLKKNKKYHAQAISGDEKTKKIGVKKLGIKKNFHAQDANNKSEQKENVLKKIRQVSETTPTNIRVPPKQIKKDSCQADLMEIVSAYATLNQIPEEKLQKASLCKLSEKEMIYILAQLNNGMTNAYKHKYKRANDCVSEEFKVVPGQLRSVYQSPLGNIILESNFDLMSVEGIMEHENNKIGSITPIFDPRETEQNLKILCEKGYEVKAIQKDVMRKSAHAEMAVDNCAKQLIEGIVRQMNAQIYVPEGRKRYQVIRVFGTVIIMPFHYLEAFKNGTIFYLTTATSVIKFVFESSMLYRFVANQDMVALNLGPRAPCAKDVRNLFITMRELGEYKTSPGFLVNTSLSTKCRTQNVEFLKEINLISTNVFPSGVSYDTTIEADGKIKGAHTMTFGIHYPVCSMSGYCGSIIMRSNKQCATKLMGMHVASHNSFNYGYGEIICQEDLNNLYNSIDTKESIVCAVMSDTYHENYEDTEEKYENDLRILTKRVKSEDKYPKVDTKKVALVACVPPKEQVPTSGKTDLLKSPIFDKLYIHKTEPSILRPDDYRLDKEIVDNKIVDKAEEKKLRGKWSPLVAGIAKYGEEVTPFSKDDIKKVERHLIKKFKEKHNYLKRRQVMSDEEMINGIPKTEFWKTLDMSTSPGYPYCLTKGEIIKQRKISGKGKSFLFQEESAYENGAKRYTIFNEEVKRRIAEREANAKEGKLYETLTVETAKDERRKFSKIYGEPSTRTFTVLPVDLNLLVRKYFMDFAAMVKETRHEHFCKVGINPDSLEWTHMFSQFKKVGDYGFAGDYAKFDGIGMPEIYNSIVNVINAWYGDGNDTIRRVLISEMYNRYSLAGDSVYRIDQGLPSGFPLTVEFNSFMNYYFLAIAWLHLAQTSDYSEEATSLLAFDKYTCIAAYGDDNIIAACTEALEFYNLISISKFLKQYGITYTDDQKRPLEESDPFVKLEEVTFLKREFKNMDSTGLIKRAPLNVTSIMEQLNWLRKSDDDMVALASNIEDVLYESSVHGKELYDKVYKGIEELACYHSTFGKDLVSYEEQLARWWHNISVDSPRDQILNLLEEGKLLENCDLKDIQMLPESIDLLKYLQTFTDDNILPLDCNFTQMIIVADAYRYDADIIIDRALIEKKMMHKISVQVKQQKPTTVTKCEILNAAYFDNKELKNEYPYGLFFPTFHGNWMHIMEGKYIQNVDEYDKRKIFQKYMHEDQSVWTSSIASELNDITHGNLRKLLTEIPGVARWTDMEDELIMKIVRVDARCPYEWLRSLFWWCFYDNIKAKVRIDVYNKRYVAAYKYTKWIKYGIASACIFGGAVCLTMSALGGFAWVIAKCKGESEEDDDIVICSDASNDVKTKYLRKIQVQMRKNGTYKQHYGIPYHNYSGDAWKIMKDAYANNMSKNEEIETLNNLKTLQHLLKRAVTENVRWLVFIPTIEKIDQFPGVLKAEILDNVKMSVLMNTLSMQYLNESWRAVTWNFNVMYHHILAALTTIRDYDIDNKRVSSEFLSTRKHLKDYEVEDVLSTNNNIQTWTKTRCLKCKNTRKSDQFCAKRKHLEQKQKFEVAGVVVNADEFDDLATLEEGILEHRSKCFALGIVRCTECMVKKIYDDECFEKHKILECEISKEDRIVEDLSPNEEQAKYLSKLKHWMSNIEINVKNKNSINVTTQADGAFISRMMFPTTLKIFKWILGIQENQPRITNNYYYNNQKLQNCEDQGPTGLSFDLCTVSDMYHSDGPTGLSYESGNNTEIINYNDQESVPVAKIHQQNFYIFIGFCVLFIVVSLVCGWLCVVRRRRGNRNFSHMVHTLPQRL